MMSMSWAGSRAYCRRQPTATATGSTPASRIVNRLQCDRVLLIVASRFASGPRLQRDDRLNERCVPGWKIGGEQGHATKCHRYADVGDRIHRADAMEQP